MRGDYPTAMSFHGLHGRGCRCCGYCSGVSAAERSAVGKQQAFWTVCFGQSSPLKIEKQFQVASLKGLTPISYHWWVLRSNSAGEQNCSRATFPKSELMERFYASPLSPLFFPLSCPCKAAFHSIVELEGSDAALSAANCISSRPSGRLCNTRHMHIINFLCAMVMDCGLYEATLIRQMLSMQSIIKFFLWVSSQPEQLLRTWTS